MADVYRVAITPDDSVTLIIMEDKEASTIRVKTDTDEFILHGRPCELSAFSYIAENRYLPKERTYFNVDKKVRHRHVARDLSICTVCKLICAFLKSHFKIESCN